MESLAPVVKTLSRTEMTGLMEHIFTMPEVKPVSCTHLDVYKRQRIRYALTKFLGAEESEYVYECLRLFMLGPFHGRAVYLRGNYRSSFITEYSLLGIASPITGSYILVVETHYSSCLLYTSDIR